MRTVSVVGGQTEESTIEYFSHVVNSASFCNINIYAFYAKEWIIMDFCAKSHNSFVWRAQGLLAT